MRARLAGLLAVLQIAAIGWVPQAAAADSGEKIPVVANPACHEPLISATWAADRFSDVARTNAHAADIACIAQHGITTGVGDGSYYAPSVPVLRWQMALFMSRAVHKAGVELPDPSAPFPDLAELSTAETEGVMAAVALGIMPAIEPSLFVPDAPVPRADMALFLARMLDLTTTEASPVLLRIGPAAQVVLSRADGETVTTSHPFVDVEDRVEEADQQAIAALYVLGVARGTSQDTFSPDRLVTRAQMASFIVRALGYTSLRPSAAAEAPEPMPAGAQRLAEAFQTVVARRQAPPNTCLVGFLNDHVVFEHLPDRPLLPASLMKVVTAAVFLEQVGPDHRFTTEVFVDRAVGEAVENGVLEGDLYLVGGGDPVLSTPRYIGRYNPPRSHTDITILADTVAASLTDLGVRIIEGAVIADESHYPEQERHYGDKRLTPDGEPIWKSSYVTTNQAGPLSALLLNDGFTSYWGHRHSFGRAADPALHAARVFDDLLEARGFIIRRSSGKGKAPSQPERISVGTVLSPPAHEIIARMLRYSDNTTAEMLLKEIGRLSGLGSSWYQSTKASNEILLKLMDMPVDTTAGIQVADGSGLSYSNRLTCRTVAELLRRAGPGSALVEGLAVSGESGTLQYCSPGYLPAGATRPDGRQVRGKTGTLNDSMALAGIAVAPNGDVITFAMIAHHPLISVTLGYCNVLRRAVMGAAIGHPYR